MIHELRTYGFRPSGHVAFLKAYEEVGIAIRGNDYGELLGIWHTEIGPLNQVLHLWAYEDLNERQRLRAELGRNEAWINEFVPKAREALLRQEIRLLNPILSVRPPGQPGNVYELRTYRAGVGRALEFAHALEEVLPVREKYSKIVGLWVAEAAQPNEVSHLWAYPDLNARAETRGRCAQDPEWREFLARGGPCLEEMHSTILVPAAFSPLA